MSNDKITSRPLLALALAAAAVTILSSWPVELTCDDAFITMRYSENLARGRGLVFNPGQKIYGTSAPLYALVLAGMRVLGVPLLSAARMVSLASALGLLWAGARLGRKVFGDAGAGVLGSLFLLTLPPVAVLGMYGMETFLFLFILATAFALIEDRPWFALAILGIGLGVRIEAAAALFSCSLFLTFRARGVSRAYPLMLAALFVIIFMLAGQLYYGSPLPASVLRKASKPSTLAGAATVAGYFAAMGFGVYPPWVPWLNPGLGLPLFAVLGLLRRGEERKRLWPLLGFSTLYFLAYTASGKQYAMYFVWYFVPPLMAVCFPAAAGISGGVSRLMEKLGRPRLGQAGLLLVMAAWLMLSAYPLMLRIKSSAAERNVREREYATAGIWLRLHSPENAVVAGPEIGAVGFFSERQILDTFGLVSPEIWERGARVAVPAARPGYFVIKYYFKEAEWAKEETGDAYAWLKWRNLWIGARKDLPLPQAAELTRIYSASSL
jgi:hypothetical protein